MHRGQADAALGLVHPSPVQLSAERRLRRFGLGGRESQMTTWMNDSATRRCIPSVGAHRGQPVDTAHRLEPVESVLATPCRVRIRPTSGQNLARRPTTRAFPLVRTLGLTGFEHVRDASGDWGLTGSFAPFYVVRLTLLRRRAEAHEARRTRFRTSFLARIWHAIRSWCCLASRR